MFDTILPLAIEKTATAEQIACLADANDDNNNASRQNIASSRKRKAHKKSRRGCENCKLRRVKCDEAQPKCQKCKGFAIDCSYDTKSAALRFAGESSFAVENPARVAPCSKAAIIASFAPPRTPRSASSRDTDDLPQSFRWTLSDLEVLAKFQERTVLTLGAKSTGNLYQNEFFRLAIHSPFLTHVVLTLTLLHERFLTGTASIGERATMHWLRGIALFQEGLIRPGNQTQRDALWASAVILGCIQFACIEARTAHEAWPLKATSSDDLDWLKMSHGKEAVWRITDPSRPESIFNALKGHPNIYKPTRFDVDDLGDVTAEFCNLFGLGPSSNGEINPYHDVAITLARLLPIECNRDTILNFLVLIGKVHPKLKRLLEQKDPKALLLIACWYAKVYKYQWWIYRRGLLEGTAICIYLDRYYSHAESIQSLLAYAKVAFGLVFLSDQDDCMRQSQHIVPQMLKAHGG